MTGADLLTKLRHAGFAMRVDGDALVVRPRELLTDELRIQIREHKPAILAALQDAANEPPKRTGTEAAELEQEHQDDPATETRRRRVLEILEANPGFKYAVISDSDSEPGAVVVHIGIRGVASGEIVIASASYDGLVLLKALENAT